MNRLRRFLPVIGAAILAGILELAARFPEGWAWLVAAIFITVLLVGALITNFERLPRGWWHTLIAPFLLAASALLLVLFVNTDFARHFLSAVVGALILLFLEHLWRYYWAPDRYHNEALENASLAMTTVTMWFTAALFFNILLDPGVLVAIIARHILAVATVAMLLMVIGLDFGTIWVQRYPRGKVWLWLIANSLVVSEVFWVTNFLPHRVEVKTFLVVLTYYLLTHLGRAHLDGRLTPPVARRYAYMASGCLLAVFLTARWLV